MPPLHLLVTHCRTCRTVHPCRTPTCGTAHVCPPQQGLSCQAFLSIPPPLKTPSPTRPSAPTPTRACSSIRTLPHCAKNLIQACLLTLHFPLSAIGSLSNVNYMDSKVSQRQYTVKYKKLSSPPSCPAAAPRPHCGEVRHQRLLLPRGAKPEGGGGPRAQTVMK